MEILVLLAAVVANGQTVLLDFSSDTCVPCRQMAPIVAQLEQHGYPVLRVNVDRERDYAANFNVQSVPCFVLIVDGREVDRLEGATSLVQLTSMFERVGIGNANAESAPKSKQFVESSQQVVPAVVESPAVSSRLPPDRPDHAMATLADRAVSVATSSTDSPGQFVLAATVRLKVEDAQGHSDGSGTIIDVHQDEALVLTCGHIFRDSVGKGRISVDLFGPWGIRTVAGQLINFNLDRDVALIGIRPGVKVSPARVAGAGSRLSVGERILATGCDRGGVPSQVESRVLAVNRFLGPANVTIEGRPAEGRSGGGLFTRDGRLVGVCNAAGPEDNVGLYAALTTVQTELDEVGLSFVYQGQPEAVAQSPSTTPANDPLAAGSRVLQAPDSATSSLPLGHDELGGPVVQPQEDRLADIRNRLQDAEVICIVRPKSGGGPSEVIVLERASPSLAQQLAQEYRRQTETAKTAQIPPRSDSPSVIPPQ